MAEKRAGQRSNAIPPYLRAPGSFKRLLGSAPPTRTAAGRQELLTRREELCSLACVCECAGWYRKPVEILSKDEDVLPRIPDRVDLTPGKGASQVADGRLDSAGADRERTQIGLRPPLGEERHKNEYEDCHDRRHNDVDRLGRTSTPEEPDKSWDSGIGRER